MLVVCIAHALRSCCAVITQCSISDYLSVSVFNLTRLFSFPHPEEDMFIKNNGVVVFDSSFSDPGRDHGPRCRDRGPHAVRR